MDKKAFTPGPWNVENVTEYNAMASVGINISTEDLFVAGVYTREEGELDDESVATARLIAASPDMYELLEKISSIPPHEYMEIDAAQEEIETLLKKINNPHHPRQ